MGLGRGRAGAGAEAGAWGGTWIKDINNSSNIISFTLCYCPVKVELGRVKCQSPQRTPVPTLLAY